MKILLTYPAWYILLCLVAGALYAGLLYYRETRFEELSKIWKRILAVSRFLVVSIIAFFLLQPLVKTENRRVEKPVVVIAQDNSSSILQNSDSSFYSTEYLSSIQQLQKDLSDEYDVRTYTIGESVREGLNIDFKDRTTDLGTLFDELFTRYYNRNLGAVILASDGIYNHGSSPVYSAQRLKGVPVFTIALGDTTVRKDVLIGEVEYNRLAYLGNDFPVNVIVDAKKCKGSEIDVKISQNGQALKSQRVSIADDHFSKSIPFLLEARKTGMQHFRIETTILENEVSTQNNVRDIYIEVLDSRQKILLLAAAPHPDIAAISSAITSNKNYEVVSKTVSEFTENVNTYDLIILHQIPSITNPSKTIIDQAKTAKVPLVFVLGSQSSIPLFNTLETGLQIQNFRNGTTNASAVFNTGFTLFSMDEKSGRNFQRFPPLQIPFGDWKSSVAMNTLFFQKIGTVETRIPLVMYNSERDQKIGIIGGEGIWRWKMQEFAMNGNSNSFNDFIQKSVQFLASRINKSYFRVNAENRYEENQSIIVSAELYNQSYELINDAEVEFILLREDKKDFRYQFSRSASAYRLDLGRLLPGQYSYTANTTSNGKKYSVNGQFTVTPVMAEFTRTTADHQLLRHLSFVTKGEMVNSRDVAKLKSMLQQSEDIVEVVYPERRFDDLLHFRSLFFLIVFLLAMEWFIRKWLGAY